MLLFENEFLFIELKEDALLYAKWTSKSSEMSTGFFKEVNLMYVDYFNKHPIKSFIINSQEFKFIIAPEVQEWVAAEIIPEVIGKGLKKLAFIVSKEIIAQLSIEQTMEENPSGNFTLLYFDNEDSAGEWIKK